MSATRQLPRPPGPSVPAGCCRPRQPTWTGRGVRTYQVRLPQLRLLRRSALNALPAKLQDGWAPQLDLLVDLDEDGLDIINAEARLSAVSPARRRGLSVKARATHAQADSSPKMIVHQRKSKSARSRRAQSWRSPIVPTLNASCPHLNSPLPGSGRFR
jgi:hypothetical protein